MKLVRTSFSPFGIFGKLYKSDGSYLCLTCEHAYQQEDGSWKPKIPEGMYPLTRGLHRLEGMTEDFVTYEVSNVPGHTDILIHKGNTEADSHGCILLGLMFGNLNGVPAVLQSREAFDEFMNYADGLSVIPLEVS